MISAMRLAVALGGSTVMPVALAEVLEQRPVEAVEDHEVDLVRVLLALAGAAAEHLLEQDARLHRPQEDDELQVRDVDAGGEQVDGHDDARVGPVAELADALQRPVDAAGDLGDEGVAAAEDVAGLVTSWSACEVCGRSLAAKISVLGKRPYSRLVLVGVALDLLEDLAGWSRGR